MSIGNNVEQFALEEDSSTDITNDLEALMEAKRYLKDIEARRQRKLKKIRRKLVKQREKERAIINRTEEARAETKSYGDMVARRIAEKLDDPNNDLHPIMEHVLKAQIIDAEPDPEALWRLDTLEAASSLADELIGLDDFLRHQCEPIEVASISNRPRHEVGYDELQLNYGRTIPKEGLKLRIDQELVVDRNNPTSRVFRPQPVIIIPTNDRRALLAPSYNSHFLRSEGYSVEIDEHGIKKTVNNHDSDTTPTADEFKVPIPVGSKSLRDKPITLLHHDNPHDDGKVTTILAARGFSGRNGDNTSTYIGPEALRSALAELYCNSYLLGQRPAVIKAMSKIALGMLGTSYGPRMFGRPNRAA